MASFISKWLKKRKNRVEETVKEQEKEIIVEDGQHILDYLDKLSNGLISAVKPEEVVYSKEKNEFKGKDFHLICEKRDDRLAMVLNSNYKSPIGNISLGIAAPVLMKKRIFEQELIKKEVLDNFLTQSNELNKGLLEEMLKDKVENGTLSRSGKPSQFSLEIFKDGPAYSLIIESKKGKFFYSNPHKLEGEGTFLDFSEKFEIDNILITIEGELAAKIAYKKISQEEAKKIAVKKLKEEINNTEFKHLNDFKIKEATLKDGLEKCMAEDEAGKLYFKTEFGRVFSYEIQGNYTEKTDILNAYGCRIYFKDGKTLLSGNPLIITKLGRELVGKQDYGLLKEKASSNN